MSGQAPGRAWGLARLWGSEMAYPVLADCKTYLGITTSGDDAMLTAMLDAAKSLCERWTGRHFDLKTSQTVKVRPRYPTLSGQGRILLIRDVDLAAVSAVVNGDGVAVGSGDYALLPLVGPPYYLLELTRASGLIWWAGATGDGLVTLTCSTGFATTPPMIFHSIIEVVAWLYRSRSSGGGGHVTTATREGLLISPSEIPPHLGAIFDDWRRRRG